MAYEFRGAGALDYYTCRYGTSRLMFRGPRRRLEGAYVAVLGGSETYGRFTERPYPALLEGAIGLPVVNFGCMNGGLDVFLQDETVLAACRGARVTLVQITGAQNLSNRFYAVHPRRNDRFVRATRALINLYPAVDFTEFNFNRHMLRSLLARTPASFGSVVAELRAVWQERMQALISAVGGQVILVWIADHAPPERTTAPGLDADPLFVDAAMLAEVRPFVAAIVEAVASPAAQAEGTAGMVFDEIDMAVARALPGPAVHREVAHRVGPVLRRVLSH